MQGKKDLGVWWEIYKTLESTRELLYFVNWPGGTKIAAAFVKLVTTRFKPVKVKVWTDLSDIGLVKPHEHAKFLADLSSGISVDKSFNPVVP